MSLGERIYNLRTEKNMSQEELAEHLNVSRQSVSKWETDSAIPELEKLIKICDIFETSLDELTGRSSSERIETEINDIAEFHSQQNTKDEQISEKSHPYKTDLPTDNNDTQTKNGPSKKKKLIAIILSAIVFLTAVIVPFNIEEIKNIWWELNGGKIEPVFVLVHGLGGWGNDSPMTDIAHYWGGGSDDLTEYLNDKGYKTVAPSLGPVSSCWDRACELYAQLTGTTVDYGEAHSKKHGHERFGRSYETPLAENWGKRINGGQKVKINLIGHSFGGATIRLLTSLLEYGCEAELNESGKDVSPLFTGKKGSWVNSVTTLCSPHNGSSLTEVLNKIGNVAGLDSMTDLLVSLMFAFAPDSGYTKYDLMLEHFGINENSGNKTRLSDAIDKVLNSSDDHAAYDLSPDGAEELNKLIKTVDDVYYFSYSYSTTEKGNLLDVQIPTLRTLPILSPFALAMGSYIGKTKGGIDINKDWQENDGLVNVISAKYPFSEDWQVFNEDDIPRGIWNVMPTQNGDHGNIIGLNADTEENHKLWLKIFAMINELK